MLNLFDFDIEAPTPKKEPVENKPLKENLSDTGKQELLRRSVELRSFLKTYEDHSPQSGHLIDSIEEEKRCAVIQLQTIQKTLQKDM